MHLRQQATTQTKNVSSSFLRQKVAKLGSPRFRAAGNPAAFLNLVVARALESKKTTEEIIGKTLFGPEFSKTESADVRVTANSLRKALNKYYAAEGAVDPIVISLPQPPADIHIKLPRGEAYTPIFSYNPRNAVAHHYRAGLFSLERAACGFRSKWGSESTGSGAGFRLMWGRIPVGSGALFQLERNRAPVTGIVPHIPESPFPV